jgi:hypothetical protein
MDLVLQVSRCPTFLNGELLSTPQAFDLDNKSPVLALRRQELDLVHDKSLLVAYLSIEAIFPSLICPTMTRFLAWKSGKLGTHQTRPSPSLRLFRVIVT